MPDGGGSRIRLAAGMGEVDGAAWDACAGPTDPFVGHAFLKALEDSGSVGPQAGWLPRHLLLEDESGRLVGAAPMYLKSHSLGEYVFDQGWAEAYEGAGGRYYPKLQVAVPFTPVTGPRLLLRPGEGAAQGMAQEAEADALIGAMTGIAHRFAVSSVHATFLPGESWPRFTAAGWLLRTGYQFHWHNRGYRGFDDFLAALTARRRKQVRRERRGAAEAGLSIQLLTGAEVTEAHWDAFFDFYMATGARKWGRPYLTRDFFSRLGAVLAERVVLVMARRGRRWVAGALNLRGKEALYGRYWGCVEEIPFLHFELCYYRAIDFAIAHGLARVEAGAQGPHKISRGYLPVPTYSAHWIDDARLRAPVADFLAQERAAIAEDMRLLAAQSPYRAGADGESGADDGPGADGAGPAVS